MNCRFLDTAKNNAFTNMAIDETLLKDCKAPILRFYQWQPRSISLGYNQKLDEINLEECQKNNIDVVRRITGGKAVLHDNELTYSFIFPESLNLVSKEINESYKEIAQALILGLKKAGITTVVKEQPDRISTPVCFNSSNWYELLCKGKKISGSAQRRVNGIVLQHGSLLFDFDYEMHSKIFQTNEQEKQQLKQNITSINQELKNKIDVNELQDALIQGFEKTFNFETKASELTVEEKESSEQLIKEKYQTDKWNLRS